MYMTIAMVIIKCSLLLLHLVTLCPVCSLTPYRDSSYLDDGTLVVNVSNEMLMHLEQSVIISLPLQIYV